MPLYGAIEAGGTKWICATGDHPANLETLSIPTTTPEETLSRVTEFFAAKPISALGIASFGPADLRRASPTWGYITSTPKPGWANTSVAQALAKRLNVPVAFDTDVNAAALAEAHWGAGLGLSDFLYLTVGTGIGGGAIVSGRILRGSHHPEMGHLPIPRDPTDPFPGACPFHHDCLEGLASGPAMEKRWGTPAETLPADHPAWDLEARYLASGLASLTYSFSPEKIILGGGVAGSPGLLEKIRTALKARLAGYIPAPAISAPGLGPRSGILGALLLAHSLEPGQ